MRRVWVAALYLTFPLVAISAEYRVDTSSDSRMKETVAKVREALPNDQRAVFDDALKTLIANSIDMRHLFASALAGERTQRLAAGSLEHKLKSEIDGKTGAEIIAYAETIRRTREGQEKKQALQEIAELQVKKQKAQQAAEELAKFAVLRSRFYKQPRDYGRDQPIIEITVRNDTAYPISRAYFKGILASPNRAVPWLRENFNYQIPGGLEPGEEATWALAPNMFSDWGKVNAPADAVLTVTVTRLDGADEKALFSTDSFSERDAERLEKLLNRYGAPSSNEPN